MLISLQSIPEQQRSIRLSEPARSRTLSSQGFLPSLRQQDKQKLFAKSKNLFTTILKEETEEIIEDDFDTPDHTPLFDNNLPQLPKTFPELGITKPAKLSELAEENILRGTRVLLYLQDLEKLTAGKEMDTKCEFKERRSNTELRDRMLRLGENILNLYNIQFNVVEMTKQDSLMKVEKVKDRFALAKTVEVLVKEITKFPYSFFKKIGLSTLIFCQEVELYKDESNPIVTKKLLSGIFALTQMNTDQEVIDHFYKVLFSHLRNKVPDLDTHWAKVYVRKSKTVMHISMNVVVTKSTKRKKDFFEEQWRLFQELIMFPNKAIKHESNVVRIKAFKLKDCLERIDPDGIIESWWKKRGFSLVVGSLDHI